MNRQFKICIVSHAHLTNNPRVLKEAMSLANAGYNVSVITVLTDEVLYRMDLELIRGKNIHYDNSINLIRGQTNKLRIISAKLVRKFCEILSRYFKIEHPCQLSYSVREILSLARRENASLYICHNEPGLWVGKKLASDGRKVAFDFEDWYSKDYLVAGRPVSLLKKLEKSAMRIGKYITTTSNALSNALYAEYNLIKSEVIYNAFSLNERENLKINNKQREYLTFYWFSQTIGPGRGLEEIIESLNLVSNSISLHLRGKTTKEYMENLMNLLDKKHELIFHESVPPTEILDTMQSYDIGLSLELNNPPSRNLTVTNKILHYLLGGLPVLASDTTGHQEIYKLSDGAVEIIDLNDTEGTAKIINSLAQNRQKVEVMSERALKASAEIFNWENQEKVLLNSVEKALN